MAKQVKLAAQTRTATGTTAVKKIKAQGFVPAVIYAHGETPVSLQVNERDIVTLLAHAVGEHVLVDLDITGADNRLALIQEVQRNPVTQKVLHVDFHGLSATEKFEASIPVEATGDAEGVKVGGGLLEQLAHEIVISCLPKDLPEVIHVDVTALKIGESLHVKDITFPEGVTAVDPEVTVFLIAEPKVAAEAPAGAQKEPVAIKEKKPAEKAEK